MNRLTEIVYTDPAGREDRLYIDHGCPVCECRQCGPYGDDAECTCTSACGDGGTDWLPGQHPADPYPPESVPGRVY
jgi:hypothetical protein